MDIMVEPDCHDKNDNEEEPDNDLDCSWINNFDNTQGSYLKFYKEIPQKVNVYIFYVNKENIIEYQKKFKIKLNKDGILKKENLSIIIQKTKKPFYILKNILKYNFTTNPEDINKFIASNEKVTLVNYVNNIQDIKYNETVKIAQSLNALYLVYKHKEKTQNNTKKVYKLKKKYNTRRNLGNKSI